jgi:hypothetical protein
MQGAEPLVYVSFDQISKGKLICAWFAHDKGTNKR